MGSSSKEETVQEVFSSDPKLFASFIGPKQKENIRVRCLLTSERRFKTLPLFRLLHKVGSPYPSSREGPCDYPLLTDVEDPVSFL